MKPKEKSALDFFPTKRSLNNLRKAAGRCKGCHLYKHAIQTVFGSGPNHAPLMIVGEIAGEKEDKLGKPFVGPAGVFLKKNLEQAGLNHDDVYFTNVVKHFKFSYINNRKMHRSPNATEIKACVPWLHAEIAVVKPKVILCLGVVAAKSLISKKFLLRKERGKWFSYLEKTTVLVTFHPAAILRSIDEASRHEMKKLFQYDIKKIAKFLQRI